MKKLILPILLAAAINGFADNTNTFGNLQMTGVADFPVIKTNRTLNAFIYYNGNLTYRTTTNSFNPDEVRVIVTTNIYNKYGPFDYLPPSVHTNFYEAGMFTDTYVKKSSELRRVILVVFHNKTNFYVGESFGSPVISYIKSSEYSDIVSGNFSQVWPINIE